MSAYYYERFKNFFTLHYKNINLYMMGVFYTISKKDPKDPGTEKVLFQSRDFSKLTEVMKNHFLYHEAFIEISPIELMNYFLKVQYNFSIKTTHGKNIMILDENNEIEFETNNMEDLKLVLISGFNYSLRALLPYICPKCDSLLTVKKADNAYVLFCDKCEYKNIEIL